ncbi:MAG: glycosyltransferase family 2 protein [Chitinophagaceae bacterium]
MNCSILLVNYNSFELIKNAINSIFEKTEGITYEVIVVDNCSSDGEQVKKYFGDKIVYIQSYENVGFGRANNEGIKIAKGENILFLNPDTILVNNAVKILSDYLDTNETVGVVGGNLYDKENNSTHSYEKYLPSMVWELNMLFGGLISKIRYGKNYYFNYSTIPQKVGYITGADMMVRKSVLDEVGSFDKDFFMYYEETELTYRITKKGYIIMSIPEAKIIHLEGQSFLDNNLKRIQYILQSRKIYYRKTHYFFARILLNIIFTTTCFSRIVIFTLLGNKHKIKLWKTIFKNR